LKIVRISADLDCSEFDCGEKPLNHYLKKNALQNDQSSFAKCFVALDSQSKPLGYYAFSNAQIAKTSVPVEHSKGLPGYPAPAVRIGRLAIDKSAQRNGLGAQLLKDCLSRIAANSRSENSPGFRFIIVDAKHEKAARFYIKYGFVPSVDHPLVLLLPIKTILKLF